MKKLYVKNHADIQGKTFGSQGNEFMVKEIVPQEEASRCRANFVEVEPGNNAYGYHYHETEEEIFYIISGEAAVRTANGEIFLKTGDAVTFPCGPEGAHVIRNASKPKTGLSGLRYRQHSRNRPFAGHKQNYGQRSVRQGNL